MAHRVTLPFSWYLGVLSCFGLFYSTSLNYPTIPYFFREGGIPCFEAMHTLPCRPLDELHTIKPKNEGPTQLTDDYAEPTSYKGEHVQDITTESYQIISNSYNQWLNLLCNSKETALPLPSIRPGMFLFKKLPKTLQIL